MSSATVTLTPAQAAAVEGAAAHLRRGEQGVFRIGGYAGSGKTTCLRSLLEECPSAAPVAYTGKAASVLRSKGIEDAATIHSTIYRARVDEATGEVHFEPKETDEIRGEGIEGFVVDEASMVGRSLFNHMHAHGMPIVAVGDPGQLEPVGAADVNLMELHRCNHVLEEIHRQAEGSPIIELARKIRLGEEWEGTNERGARVVTGQGRPVAWDKVDMVLCAFNKTRHRLNSEARKHFGRSGRLAEGDRIVCLRNDTRLGVFNGLCGVVVGVSAIDEHLGSGLATVHLDGEKDPRALSFTFEDRKETPRGRYALIDYSYALTCHKAQGSEWPRVAVIDEQWPDKWDAARWRYTAVTRSSQSVTLVLP